MRPTRWPRLVDGRRREWEVADGSACVLRCGIGAVCTPQRAQSGGQGQAAHVGAGWEAAREVARRGWGAGDGCRVCGGVREAGGRTCNASEEVVCDGLEQHVPPPGRLHRVVGGEVVLDQEVQHVVQQDRRRPDGVEGEGAPPGAAVEAALREDLLRVDQGHVRVSGVHRLSQVVDEQRRHDRVGQLWPRDLKRAEVVHGGVAVREELVLHDRQGAGGGRHVRGDDRARRAGQHGAPVLHALGQRVVGALTAGVGWGGWGGVRGCCRVWSASIARRGSQARECAPLTCGSRWSENRWQGRGFRRSRAPREKRGAGRWVVLGLASTSIAAAAPIALPHLRACP